MGDENKDKWKLFLFGVSPIVLVYLYALTKPNGEKGAAAFVGTLVYILIGNLVAFFVSFAEPGVSRFLYAGIWTGIIASLILSVPLCM